MISIIDGIMIDMMRCAFILLFVRSLFACSNLFFW